VGGRVLFHPSGGAGAADQIFAFANDARLTVFMSASRTRTVVVLLVMVVALVAGAVAARFDLVGRQTGRAVGAIGLLGFLVFLFVRSRRDRLR
jgi:hypothetical protein